MAAEWSVALLFLMGLGWEESSASHSVTIRILPVNRLQAQCIAGRNETDVQERQGLKLSWKTNGERKKVSLGSGNLPSGSMDLLRIDTQSGYAFISAANPGRAARIIRTQDLLLTLTDVD